MAKAPVAHIFVLEALVDSKVGNEIRVKPMFGGHAVYCGDRIVLMLRRRARSPEDNGVWVVVQPDARDSVRAEFPSLR